MAYRRLLTFWRVAWPVVVWFLASGFVACMMDALGYLPDTYTFGQTSREFVIATVFQMCMLLGWLLSSLAVARRYRRLIARPVSKIVKMGLYFLLIFVTVLLVLGVFAIVSELLLGMVGKDLPYGN